MVAAIKQSTKRPQTTALECSLYMVKGGINYEEYGISSRETPRCGTSDHGPVIQSKRQTSLMLGVHGWRLAGRGEGQTVGDATRYRPSISSWT